MSEVLDFTKKQVVVPTDGVLAGPEPSAPAANSASGGPAGSNGPNGSSSSNRYTKVAVEKQPTPPASALSMLLGKSRQGSEAPEEADKAASRLEDRFGVTPGSSPRGGFVGSLGPGSLGPRRSSSIAPETSMSPSARSRKSSIASIAATPPPIGGGGFVFGAGEIGNVSSPRYSTSVSRERVIPSSVEARFIVDMQRTPSQATISRDPASSANNNSSSFLGRSFSRMSLSSRSRSSSIARQPSMSSSSVSIRRFIDKPWKKDSPDDHSPSNSVDSRASSPLSMTAAAQSFGTRSSVALNNDDANGRKASLAKSYGKLGKTLGEGAGGNVKIVKSSKDGSIYAVKEFRARHSSESQRDYSKKVGGEYCLGLTLKNPNIVETLDIIYESDKVYQIMEYCEYDLFAIVMSGKMVSEEIYCDFRQLMSGIKYLHDLGLAHRDLKLDNCVMTAEGLVKIIDFGSSVVYRYPESDRTYDAHGVVGSDPYLAPEAATGGRYDPCATDIWSSAVMLCCMLMRKFPWKAPRLTDPSFKTFVTEENGERNGLDKLLANLPDEIHPLISGMFDLDPLNRWTVNRCWEDPWLSGAEFCTKVDGKLIPAPGHAHTKVAFEDAHIALLERKNRKAKKSEKMW